MKTRSSPQNALIAELGKLATHPSMGVLLKLAIKKDYKSTYA
jgi:hypothetical protein